MKGLSIRSFRIAILAAAALGALGATADASVVALADTTGFASTANLDTTFQNAFTNSTLTVTTNATEDVSLSTAGNSRWANYGKAPLSGTGPVLVRFDLSTLANFTGGTINKAELRIRQNAGNTGTRQVGYVSTFDWAEGNKNGDYPGLAVTITATNQANYPGSQIGDIIPAAAGASYAHPAGVQSAPNKGADGNTATTLNPAQTWGSGNDFFSATEILVSNTTVAPVDGLSPGDALLLRNPKATITSSFLVWDVTDIVALWAAGTANKGFALNPVSSNYTYRMSEHASGTTDQPVLFIDYTEAAPEPASLSMLALAGGGLLRRRRKA